MERTIQTNIAEYLQRWFDGGPQYPSWSGDTVSVEARKPTEAKS